MAEITPNTIKIAIEDAEKRYRDASDQADYLRSKVQEAETLKQQLVGRVATLQELLSDLGEDSDVEEAKSAPAEA